MISALAKVVKSTLQAARPSLCFLGLKIPAMGGHDVLRWIRGQSDRDRLPVVVLSSSEHPKDIQQAAHEGAQCYLAKLRERVRRAGRFESIPSVACARSIPGVTTYAAADVAAW